MAQSRDPTTEQETAAAQLRRQWEEKQESANSTPFSKELPAWREVQKRLGNEHLQAILNQQANSSVEIYLRHLLEVEADQGLDTAPYLPWRAPPSWSNWIEPYYSVLESEALLAPQGHLQPLTAQESSGPALISREIAESQTASDDFLMDWFKTTVKRAGGGRTPTPQEREIMERVHGPLPQSMRLHDGDAASEAARGVQAKAFALGTDIYFASRPDPSSPEGAELLVHEATHVKQAVEGRLPEKTGDGLQVSSPSDPHEQEAYEAGEMGRELAQKKQSWGLDHMGDIEPTGAAILDHLGAALPERDDWMDRAGLRMESTPSGPEEAPVLRDGSGEWDAETCDPEDYAVWLAFQEISNQAEMLGLTNAARHMRHYLGNTGSPLAVNPDLMIRDLPRLEERFQEFEQEAFIAATRALDDLDTTVKQFVEVDNSDKKRSDIYAHKDVSMDWYFATGGFTHWWSASAHYTPDDGTEKYKEAGSITLFVRLHYFDVYNWDKGKSVTLPVVGVTVEDEVLQELHKCGIAKEFDMHGTSSDRVFERRYEAWRDEYSTDGQGEALNPEGASSRDGGRTDPSRTTVQYKTERGTKKPTHTKASEGLASAASPLPHRSRIQASFGSHDVSSIKAEVGGEAGEAAKSLGAQAYASGDRVAFQKGKDDLHTTAHEAAHVIQQASGKVSPGEGKPGDRHERHADAVADKVVAGESAQELLDEYGSSSSTQPTPSAPSIQRLEDGSSQSGTISALTDSLNTTSTSGQDSLKSQSTTNPDLSPQNATEDRSEKVDRFETGVDHNLDELEDYSAFDELIEAIEDDESTRSALNRLKRTTEFQNLADQWQSALSDKKDGVKLRGIFNREYDGRGFWAETEQAFALVANAAKRHARPDPNAAGADATLASLENQETPPEVTPETDSPGGVPQGKLNGQGNLEAVPENIQALLDATVSIEPESIDSYTKMESLQTEYGNIHSAYGSRDTLSQQAEIQANERGRVNEVFSTFAESLGSGFLQGALEGTTDAVVWDTLTSYGDSLIKNSSSGQMPPVIGPAFELVTSFGLYPGAEFDPTAGIGGENGDLAQMGNTFSDLSMNSQALFSGEYSGTDQLGILIAAIADGLQLIKQVIDLVNKVLGILSALLYVIAGVLIAIGIAFCWCGMAFLIPIGNQLIPIATMLSNFCKILGPISMALSVVIPLLRLMAAIFVPQELYAKQLELTASTSEALGQSTGSKLADNTVQNAKDRIATRNNPVGTDQENPATPERTRGEEEGLETAQKLQDDLEQGGAELDNEIIRHTESETQATDTESQAKYRTQEAIDITKAALDPRNFTKAIGQTSKQVFVEPFQKLSDPKYYGETLNEALDRSARVNEQEIGMEARKKVLEDDIKSLESGKQEAEARLRQAEADLQAVQRDMEWAEQDIQRWADSGVDPATVEQHKQSVLAQHRSKIDDAQAQITRVNNDIAEADSRIEGHQRELTAIRSRPTDRSNIELSDREQAQAQYDDARLQRDDAKKAYDEANKNFAENSANANYYGDDRAVAADLHAKKVAWEEAEAQLTMVLSSPLASRADFDAATADTAAKQATLDQARADAEAKNTRELESERARLTTLQRDSGADPEEIRKLELSISSRESQVGKASSPEIKQAMATLSDSEASLKVAKTRHESIEGTNNARDLEHVIKDDAGNEIGRRRAKGPGLPGDIIQGILNEWMNIDVNYLERDDGSNLIWAPDTAQQSPEELQNLPTLEPALGKIYRGVGSAAFFEILATPAPIELDTLAEDRILAETNMQNYIAAHFDAYIAYQAERESRSNIDTKQAFLTNELQPTGDLMATQKTELEGAEVKAKERQTQFASVNPEIGPADPGIKTAGKEASEGVKQGEGEMKDKPDSGATTTGASDAGGAVDDADSSTKEGQEIGSAATNEEVNMMGTMVSIQDSVSVGHQEQEISMTQKISEDEASLQTIQLEKATRLAEAESYRSLAEQHSTTYNNNTEALTEWAKKYQENRNQVHSLNG